MKNKDIFYLSDYNFKIVKLKVFSGKDENNFDNSLYYYLLIDENNFIHDYKIEFKQIYITNITTKSHENMNKMLSNGFQIRVDLLRKLGLENKWQSTPNSRKEYFLFNIDEINKNGINKWSFNKKWNDITFQMIHYILRGSNSSGEGNGKGYLWTKYNNEIFPLGFLLKSLNISNYIYKNYNNPNYDIIWDEFKNKNFRNVVNFNSWLNEDDLLNKYFKAFKYDPKRWRVYKKTLESDLKKHLLSFKKIDELIKNRYRREYVENIESLYNDVKQLYLSFFEINKKEINTRYDKAHIKPVWLIKKEYLLTKNHSLLNQISDPNNFLPLAKNIHDLYDNKYFYWDENGKLIKLKKLNENEILNFKQIAKNKIPLIQNYLNEYYKKVIKNIKSK